MTAIAVVQVPRALAPVIKGLVNLDSAKPHTSLIEAAPATRVAFERTWMRWFARRWKRR
jgi:hypothetical protein